MSRVVADPVTFLLLLMYVLAGSSVLRAAERKGHALSRDLQGTFLLDGPGRARSSTLPFSALGPVATADLSRPVLAMIAHSSLLVSRAVEPLTGILTCCCAESDVICVGGPAGAGRWQHARTD
jgi:hypothetical protein